ncbi:transferase [Gaertneriomyces semiglobifer]|nr:transferase [Gaertneriomyces semiglobifer]
MISQPPSRPQKAVVITARRTVLAADPTSWKALPSPFVLGPLDSLTVPIVPIAVLFVYKQQLASADAQLIVRDQLYRALSRLLDYYPHLTGRLQFNSSDGSIEIGQLGAGADFLEAECGHPLSDFSRNGSLTVLDLPDGGNALLAPYDLTVEGVFSKPLLTLQHTHFACGRVVLGIRVHHGVCDADGYFQLVRDLAELYRGFADGAVQSHLSSPPHVSSYQSQLMNGGMTLEERQLAQRYKPSLFYVDTEGKVATDLVSGVQTTSRATPVTGRVMCFSGSSLAALKAYATEPGSGTSWVSTFEALSGLLYRCVHRARVQLRIVEPSEHGSLSFPDFLTSVNLRARMGPEIFAPRYFPNGIMTVFTSVSPELLENGPLWQIVKALHDLLLIPAITSADDVVNTVRWIAAQSDKRQIKQGFRFGNGSFMVTQWNKMDMYDGASFEAPPLMVMPPFTAISSVDGLAHFLPSYSQANGVNDKDALVVTLSLSEPVWAFLDKDEEFRRFVYAPNGLVDSPVTPKCASDGQSRH